MVYRILVIYYSLAVLCVSFGTTMGGLRCVNKEDCNSLGTDVVCVKSECAVGRCGCQPPKVMKLISSENRYMCVPLKKIGEPCSPCGKKGLCGAPNSVCDTSKERCVCESGKVPSICGEYCTDPGKTHLGDVCGASTCISGSCSTQQFGEGNYPPQCQCTDGSQHVELTNEFTGNKFVGSNYPRCVKNRVGDFCTLDFECFGILHRRNAAAECKDNKCKCSNNSFVPDVSGLFCGPALAKGDNCTELSASGSTGQVCEGSDGLMCQKNCDGKAPTQRKCVCSYTHKDVGSNCVARIVGDACFGDANCKAISSTAACVDGKCAETRAVGASAYAIPSMATIVTSLLFGIHHLSTLM